MKTLLSIFALSLLCTALSAQWQKIDVPFEPFELSVVDSNTIWSFNWNSGKMARSSDGAINWTLHDIPNAQGFLLGEFINAFDTLNAWVSFNSYESGIKYVYRTLDGGQTWQARKPAGLSNDQSINFQKFYSPNKGILISQDFNNHVFVYRTNNAGQNWTTKTLTINGSHLGTTTYGDQNIWFYTGSGELWRSNDGGQNWSTFQTGIVATSYGLAFEFADSLNGLAFKDRYFNQLYKTTNGGASWQPVSNPTASETFIWGLTKIPNLPHAWILGYNEGSAYSLDDGTSWFSEINYPDYDFRKPVFLNNRQGWGLVNGYSAVFKWQDALDAPLNGCVEFLGPLTGKLRRAECNFVRFQGSIRANIANDPGFHIRTELFFPDNTMYPSTQTQTLNNVRTSCPTCPLNFVPDSGQTTIGEIHFDIPVWYAYDTSQAILCTVSPTVCKEDTSNTYQFHTGYFANWFHPECFSIDTSNCAIELKTNVCGQDTNHYLIYYRVRDNPAVLGTHYEKNPTNGDLISFYIFAYGDYQTSTCYQIIDTIYYCGTSGTTAQQGSNTTSIQIAPNPANGSFQIFCDKLPGQQISTIRIKTAAGSLVWTEKLPSGVPSLFIEKHDLAPGFYLVELWTGNQLAAFNKLIVVKNR
ncbi:MAG: hypothetical protein WCR52_19855 [Bacteroidota bacterium]